MMKIGTRINRVTGCITTLNPISNVFRFVRMEIYFCLQLVVARIGLALFITKILERVVSVTGNDKHNIDILKARVHV